MAKYCINCGYTLTGLVEHRCPECGLPFDADNASTYATEQYGLHRQAALAASFTGAIIGWAVGYAVNAVVSSYCPEWAYPARGIVFSSFFLVVGWWLSLALLVLLWKRTLVLLRSKRRMPLLSVAWALVGLWLVRGAEFTRGGDAGEFLGLNLWAAVIGVCVGLAIRIMVSHRSARSARGIESGFVLGLWLLGPLSIAGWLVFGWPLLCSLFPNFAVQVGSDRTREKLVRRVLRDVHVGDRLDVLYGQLPAYFGRENDVPDDGDYGYKIGSNWVFTIKVQDGVIRDLLVLDGR